MSYSNHRGTETPRKKLKRKPITFFSKCELSSRSSLSDPGQNQLYLREQRKFGELVDRDRTRKNVFIRRALKPDHPQFLQNFRSVRVKVHDNISISTDDEFLLIRDGRGRPRLLTFYERKYPNMQLFGKDASRVRHARRCLLLRIDCSRQRDLAECNSRSLATIEIVDYDACHLDWDARKLCRRKFGIFRSICGGGSKQRIARYDIRGYNISAFINSYLYANRARCVCRSACGRKCGLGKIDRLPVQNAARYLLSRGYGTPRSRGWRSRCHKGIVYSTTSAPGTGTPATTELDRRRALQSGKDLQPSERRIAFAFAAVDRIDRHGHFSRHPA